MIDIYEFMQELGAMERAQHAHPKLWANCVAADRAYDYQRVRRPRVEWGAEYNFATWRASLIREQELLLVSMKAWRAFQEAGGLPIRPDGEFDFVERKIEALRSMAHQPTLEDLIRAVNTIDWSDEDKKRTVGGGDRCSRMN